MVEALSDPPGARVRGALSMNQKEIAMTQTYANGMPNTTENFNKAAAALTAAQRDAHAAIDSAVDGIASAYTEGQPLLARLGRQTRGYAHDSMDAMRQAAGDARERGLRAVDSTRGYVRDEPLKSLLIAAAVGAAVIGLVELVRVRRDR
jgi:ElaB/YqjD/DUF883 family membrane-anchored ribosome-binding protein